MQGIVVVVVVVVVLVLVVVVVVVVVLVSIVVYSGCRVVVVVVVVLGVGGLLVCSGVFGSTSPTTFGSSGVLVALVFWGSGAVLVFGGLVFWGPGADGGCGSETRHHCEDCGFPAAGVADGCDRPVRLGLV